MMLEYGGICELLTPFPPPQGATKMLQTFFIYRRLLLNHMLSDDCLLP